MLFKLVNSFTFLLILSSSNICKAQWSTDYISYQKSFPKVNHAFSKRLDSLKTECAQKNIQWPIQQVYLRSFKYENLLEIWLKDEQSNEFQFFRSVKVCGTNGKLGPKRKEGDKQVPEGFYYVNEFNPNSNYHLSLGINYPNTSDKILSDAVKPGGQIFIHGDCVSVGCLAINDEQIEDLYVLSTVAKSNGQEFIPVHIFPGKFNQLKSRDAIVKMAKENQGYTPFVLAMQNAFYYFEKERKLPAILINAKGEYVVEDVEVPIITNQLAVPKIKINNHKIRKYEPNELAVNVSRFPTFDGGNAAYLEFVKSLSSELTSYLTAAQSKAYVYVEFVVNVDGTVSNVSITRGGTESMAEAIATRLEKTKNWTPALKDGVEVAYKMTQTFFIELQK